MENDTDGVTGAVSHLTGEPWAQDKYSDGLELFLAEIASIFQF